MSTIKAFTVIKYLYLPTTRGSHDFWFFLKRAHMSIVNSVLALLKTDVSDDIRADIITASMRPLAPSGSRFTTNLGYALSPQPYSFPQAAIQS